MDFRRSQLRAFLTARRAALQPEMLGLPRGARRLSAGLKREEVAVVAGVSVTWYTWLEQGREIATSAETLHRIAKALRLNDPDEAYLFWLAGILRPVTGDGEAISSPAIESVLTAFQGPAVVLDPLFNLVAANRLAERLYDFASCIEPYPRSQIWQLFVNPARAQLYVDYSTVAAAFVALFRLSAANNLNDPEYEELVEALSKASPLFAELWNAQTVASFKPDIVGLTHPDFGRIEVQSVRMVLPGLGHSFAVMLTPANDETRQTFARLLQQETEVALS